MDEMARRYAAGALDPQIATAQGRLSGSRTTE